MSDTKKRDNKLIRYCEHCGKPCPRREKEHNSGYLKKRFCSHEHSVAHKRKQRWNDRHRGDAPTRTTIPAATEAEWLRLNGGPTMCPPMYCEAVEHDRHVPAMSRMDGRVR